MFWSDQGLENKVGSGSSFQNLSGSGMNKGLNPSKIAVFSAQSYVRYKNSSYIGIYVARKKEKVSLLVKIRK